MRIFASIVLVLGLNLFVISVHLTSPTNHDFFSFHVKDKDKSSAALTNVFSITPDFKMGQTHETNKNGDFAGAKSVFV